MKTTRIVVIDIEEIIDFDREAFLDLLEERFTEEHEFIMLSDIEYCCKGILGNDARMLRFEVSAIMESLEDDIPNNEEN